MVPKRPHLVVGQSGEGYAVTLSDSLPRIQTDRQVFLPTKAVEAGTHFNALTAGSSSTHRNGSDPKLLSENEVEVTKEGATASVVSEGTDVS